MTQERNAMTELPCTATGRHFDASTSRDPYVHEIALGGALTELADTTKNERQRAPSFEPKLEQSTITVSLVRNTTPTTVPINTLPPEILTRIFQLVLDPSPPPLSMSMFPLPQDVLSHVCSHWRQLAISSHKFWSLIDFALFELPFDQHLDRAKTYAARAGPALLHVRIYLTFSILARGTFAHSRLAEFLSTIAPRIKSFFFSANGELAGSCRSLMESCLAAATPGTLSTLIMSVYSTSDYVHEFFEPIESPNINQSLLLDVDQERLEATLLPIRVLWLERLYPYWTSKAYHGLTELRIHTSGWSLSITESQLVDILVACPKLRTLSFPLNITNSHSQHGSKVPVHLAELENLAVSFDGDEEATALGILRLLAPGPKPFVLYLGGGDLDTRMLGGSVQEFLSRTNVEKMSLSGTGSYLVVSGVLRSSPHLRELNLSGVDVTKGYRPAEPNANARSTSIPGLVSLSLAQCTIELDTLRQIVEDMKISSLSVWLCFCSNVNDRQEISEKMLYAALSDLCYVRRTSKPKGFRDEYGQWEKQLQVEWDV